MSEERLPEPQGYPDAEGHAPGRGRALCVLCHQGWPCPTARKNGVTKADAIAEVLEMVREVHPTRTDPS